VIGLSLASALISALLLATPWSIVVAILSVAAALLALTDLKTRARQTAEHAYLMSQTPEGELAMVADGHAAETELDALVREHFEEIPDTDTIACRHCDWQTDDFASRLRLGPAHLHEAHPEHDPRVPQSIRLRAKRWLAGLI
jgi:hypothetical protein